MNLGGLITERGYQILKKRLAELITTRERALSDMVEARTIPGDDNPELIYSSALLVEADNNIAHLEEVLASSLVMQTKSTEEVGFGSEVSYEDECGSVSSGMIVGTNEIIYTDHGISALSPMAEAMFGLREGDEFDVMVGNKVTAYKIIAIE